MRLRFVVIVMLSAVAMVAAVLVPRGFDVSRFVVAGEANTDVALAPDGLLVQSGSGYDGQFYYRLAVAPVSRADRVAGVRFDLPSVRQQRIVYPLVAGLLSGFNPERVPAALVVTNVLSFGLLAWASAARLEQLGRHPAWAVSVVSFPGFLVSLWFDLAEILATGFLVAGLAAVASRRWRSAGVFFTLAALTRETTLIVPIAGLVVWAVTAVRSESRPTSAGFSQDGLAPAFSFGVPVATIALWQTVVYAVWGSWPAVSGAALNLGLPFSGLWSNVREAATNPSPGKLASLVVAAGLWGFVAMVVRSLRRSEVMGLEKVSWISAVLLMSLLTTFMYSGPQHFLRAFTETWVLGSLILAGDSQFEARGSVFRRSVPGR